MSFDDRIFREMACTIKQVEAMNYVLHRTYEALMRYDPAKNASEPRELEPDEDPCE